MAEPDRRAVDRHGARGAVGDVAGTGRHCVGEAEAVGGRRAVRHDPDAVAARERGEGGVEIDRCGAAKQGADPGRW